MLGGGIEREQCGSTPRRCARVALAALRTARGAGGIGERRASAGFGLPPAARGGTAPPTPACHTTSLAWLNLLAEGCEVGDWEPWPECPVTCGRGMRHRQRFYVNAEVATERGCKRALTSRQQCAAGLKQCPG